MLSRERNCDIAIVGRGITALSCAHHLRLKDPGLKITIIGDRRRTSYLAPGIAYRSPKDNLTRLYDMGGFEEAQEQYEYYASAFEYFLNWLKHQNHNLTLADFFRLGANHLEDQEIESGHKLQTQLAKGSSSIKSCKPSAKDLPFLKTRQHYFALREHKGLCFFSPNQLLENLEKPLRCDKIKQHVINIEESSGGVELNYENGQRLKAEMVVLACHSEIGQLEPSLKSVIVPFSDQYCAFKTGQKATYGLTFQHGLHWKAQLGNLCFLGGARYLRKHAGIGSRQALYDLSIEEHLKKLMHLDRRAEIISRNAFLGIRPCDERPVIGPVPGKLRTLVATGYMQRGWTLGLFAGKSLSEIILDGECRELPRLFWPERFRF